jgi:L-seryl-tRNA(Ser) seleniumtransferase
MLVVPRETLAARATAVVAALADKGVPAEAVDCVSAVGGGGAPGVELPSAAIALAPDLALALRRGRPPVVGRVEADRCLLDLRTVDPADDNRLVEAVLTASSG